MGRDLQKWWIRTLIYSLLTSLVIVSAITAIDLLLFGFISHDIFMLSWSFLFLFSIYLKAEDYPVN